MLRKRLQNRIAESRIALPLTAVYALVVCVAGGLFEQGHWLSFLLLAMSSFLMMELNNANALIRIYSRMVSCTYIMLAVMAHFLFADVANGVVQLCFVSFLLFFFHAYQDKRAVGHVFYGFLMLGIGSIFFVQILYLVPVLWILLYTNVMAGSARTFFASLFGLAVPYWFVGGYDVYAGDIWSLVEHFRQLTVFSPLTLEPSISVHQALAVALVVLFGVVGIVHFHRNSYKDKIRTRMLFEVFMTVAVCLFVFMVLQPQHVNSLLGMLIVCVAPLWGHFAALTHTRLTNLSFVLFVLMLLSATIYNIWMP